MLLTEKMQETIGIVLLLGTLIALSFVIIGGSLFLYQSGYENLQTELLQNANFQTSVKEIIHLALQFSPLGIIELGLLTLVVTQILRVALLVFFYAIGRDGWFTLISLFILTTLIYSLFWRD